MKNSVVAALLGMTMFVAGRGSVVFGALVAINPSKDNSIYQENDNSNGLGSLYTGRTGASGGNSLRRALLSFDIVGSGIPSGSTINSVTLTLRQTAFGPLSTSEAFELHPLLVPWGEGTSIGTGTGGLPSPGDATWNYRLYSTNAWTSPGGDFGSLSGSTIIGATSGLYTFNSQAGMVTDVQSWLNTPASNFGWLLRAADESPTFHAREFGSRESIASQRPVLTIDFTAAVPEPGSCLLLSAAAMVVSAHRSRRRRV